MRKFCNHYVKLATGPPSPRICFTIRPLIIAFLLLLSLINSTVPKDLHDLLQAESGSATTNVSNQWQSSHYLCLVFKHALCHSNRFRVPPVTMMVSDTLFILSLNLWKKMIWAFPEKVCFEGEDCNITLRALIVAPSHMGGIMRNKNKRNNNLALILRMKH